MPVKAIPEGYHSVTPIFIDGAAAALDFYKRAFGATELMRMPMGDRIGHAEIKLGDSHVMLSDEWPEMGHLSPKKRGGTSVSLMFYVENPDAVFDRAIKAGATVEAGRKSVLRRPYRHAEGPVRARVVDRRARRGRSDGRNEAAHGIVDEGAREDPCLSSA